MAIIGELIKKAINLRGVIKAEPNPVEAQYEVLLQLIERAKHTVFGKKYQFQQILDSKQLIESFQQRVPIHDYDKMYKDWWHFLIEGHQNVTWPGGQQYFAISSGTTSHSKYIPVSDDMLEAIRKAAIQQILSLKNFDLPPEFYTKQIMMLGSSTQLTEKDDHFEGDISGISASNIPFWFKGFYKPGFEISAIDDWHEKVKRIAQEAPNWDVGSITGIPSWAELMLKEIISYNKLETIHDIWPNLTVYTSGGVAFEPYRKSFEKLTAKPLIYIDTYLASEGYLATQKRPDTDAMALITNNGIFFEFVPFNASNLDENGMIKNDAEVFTLQETEEGIAYILLISTVSGAWRYMIGDTVMITDKERAEIKITGRTKHYLNVVGEQLSVHQMNKAMEKLERQYNIEIKEFTVAALKQNDEYINKWYIGTNNPSENFSLAEDLDRLLCEENKNYHSARNKALKKVEVKLIPIEKFYQWSEDHKKLGGQVKIPRVMKEEDFLRFEDYIMNLP